MKKYIHLGEWSMHGVLSEFQLLHVFLTYISLNHDSISFAYIALVLHLIYELKKCIAWALGVVISKINNYRYIIATPTSNITSSTRSFRRSLGVCLSIRRAACKKRKYCKIYLNMQLQVDTYMVQYYCAFHP